MDGLRPPPLSWRRAPARCSATPHAPARWQAPSARLPAHRLEGRCHQRAREDSNLRPAVSAQSDALAPGRTISSPFHVRPPVGVPSGVGRRALPVRRPMPMQTGCGVIGGAPHPLVSTPSAGCGRLWKCATRLASCQQSRTLTSEARCHLPRPAGDLARDYPSAFAGVGFPEFTRFAAARLRAGPLFAEGNRRSILAELRALRGQYMWSIERIATRVTRPAGKPCGGAHRGRGWRKSTCTRRRQHG